MDFAGVTWRWHPCDEAQALDPLIAAKMGVEATPAYHGTAYVVFEELPLERYANGLPQLCFEVFRPLAEPDTAEGLVRAVTLIPPSGEFVYATQAIPVRGPTSRLSDARRRSSLSPWTLRLARGGEAAMTTEARSEGASPNVR